MNSPSLPRLLLTLWSHLSLRRRRQFIVLGIIMVVTTASEIVSLGAVLPFLAVLVAPEKLFEYELVRLFANSQGITAPRDLIFPLTALFAGAALLAGTLRLFLLWVGTRISFATGADLSLLVYKHTLYQPYQTHMSTNSSKIISGIVNKTNKVVFDVLLSLLTISSSAVLLIGMTLTLIWINPQVAIISIAGFGLSYIVTTLSFKKRLRRNSETIANAQTQVVKTLQEGLSGIRDVIIDGTQELYCEIYRKTDKPLRLAQGNNTFISGSPRFIMESLGMILIALLAYSLTDQPGGLSSSIPLLGALALGAQRILPILQNSYSAYVNMAASQASLRDTLELLSHVIPDHAKVSALPRMEFKSAVKLENVTFRYDPQGPAVAKGINISIEKGRRIGITGKTGSGKSTVMDILMGLLIPNEGHLTVDGTPVTGSHIRSWQKNIAHVPQFIYLSDATIAENIAFGVPAAEIDMNRVKQAAAQAQISEFIESKPDGYDTIVGERGIYLSGGQRQRIGIARALYKNASLLVLDEATSALDNATEESVMNSIFALDQNLTVVIIAHRLSTIKRCDLILEIDQGEVIAQGPFEELLKTSPTFRKQSLLA